MIIRHIHSIHNPGMRYSDHQITVDEKGGVAVSITALFVWLSILIKPLMFSIQRDDTWLRAGGAHVHG